MINNIIVKKIKKLLLLLKMGSQSLAWYKLLEQHRAIAVIRATSIESGLNMAQAVADGGIKLIEITWKSVQPENLISKLKIKLPDCFIGAGTILNEENLDLAINSGAEFIFSPHLNFKLIHKANLAKIPIIPGALSPTEIVTAWQAGANCVKVFPIQCVGGINYIKALQGPLEEIPLIPTGGVTIDNAANFIAAGAIAVGLSTSLFPQEAILNQDWQIIRQKAELLCALLKNK